jgi:hypothetical protein
LNNSERQCEGKIVGEEAVKKNGSEREKETEEGKRSKKEGWECGGDECGGQNKGIEM